MEHAMDDGCRMVRALRATLVLGVMATLAACAAAPAKAPVASRTASPLVGRETVNATLWMQRAAEYRIATTQAFGLATDRFASTIAAPGTAALEQRGMDPARLAALPTAVIVDLDETILDNSYFQARRALAGGEYDEAAWQSWMMEAAATLIPGAREFLAAAARAGHRIFYVTNRGCPRQRPATGDPCPAKTATRRNLVALGLPNADDPSTLLLRAERPEWDSGSKSSRRAFIAQTHRIVALAGDDLNDFVDRAVFEQRREALMPLFGARWFLLSNAMYGSWERALLSGACAPAMTAAECAAANTARKYSLLEPVPAR